MKLQLRYSLTIFLLALLASTHAAISPEVYWKVKLPNTQIPKVIKDFLPQSDDVVPELKQDNNNIQKKVYYGLSGYIAISWHDAATEEYLREMELHSNTDTKEKAATKYDRRVLKKENPSMNCDTNKNELRQVTDDLKDDHPLKQYFLLEEDLEKGKAISFPSLLNKNEAPFLPRQFVESIPFSMKKISEILNHFSIDSGSKDAQAIVKTIKLCEEPEVKHKEKKICATSLESMVDFSLSMLGTNNILAITSEVEGETQKSQRYTIEEVEQIADGDNMVCHKLNYAYALHYCHVGGSTKTFMVSMVGDDGTKVKALSVCHKDTSFWNPKAFPFVFLKVKPGTTPICHFLQDDQIVFVPSK
ncbi:BURP domain-containing protein 6-like [Nicotiana tabacum]|uniref:BURP domain-containing protein 5-like n=2 Tax=Nicotiana TaxID=4085 RepID=A0A1S3ZWD3_TOBAC|nr:PREDICTED: BURP domain-containing protein 5-like [Nicotiana sylvestris]XP_016468682.1 PREDICTED: BURP domain-containing protein 5-like [Nicotiana tabacum]